MHTHGVLWFSIFEHSRVKMMVDLSRLSVPSKVRNPWHLPFPTRTRPRRLRRRPRPLRPDKMTKIIAASERFDS